MPGIFITKGMSLSIPAGGLKISIADDGKVNSEVRVHVRFDTCQTWASLAVQHLRRAQEHRALRLAAWSGTDEAEKGRTLEQEFEASMQAMVAAAIAWDAFYALVKEHVDLPKGVVESWRKKRTSRHIQVTEVVRQAFTLKPKGASALRQNLKEIFKYRDLAVHPSGAIDAPVLHPELNVGVEWRFATFRAVAAEQIVNSAIGMLWDLAQNGKAASPTNAEFMKALREHLTSTWPVARHSAQSALAEAPIGVAAEKPAVRPLGKS